MFDLIGNWRHIPAGLKYPFYFLVCMNLAICIIAVVGYQPPTMPEALSKFDLLVFLTEALILTYIAPMWFILNLVGYFHRRNHEERQE